MKEVVITQSRAGCKTAYRAGQTTRFTDEKAAQAVGAGWAKYAEETIEEVEESQAITTIDDVFEVFGYDADSLRAQAEQYGIFVHARTRKPATIAKKILDAITEE
jgi:DNA polymerase elongation subunit (family B)